MVTYKSNNRKNDNTLFKSERSLIDFSKPMMVSMESFAPTDLNDGQVRVSDDMMTWENIPFMYYDIPSRNNNIYPKADTLRSFKESTWIQENLRNGTLGSELGHPPADSTLARFMKIEETRLAAIITEYHDAGDHMRGSITLAAPLGTSIVLPNIRKLNTNFGMSCRISTPNYVVREQGGRKIYVKKYKMYPVTCGDLIYPGSTGFAQCRVYKDGSLRVGLRKDPLGGTESADSLYIAEFSDPASTITEMLKSEESGRIVSDIYGIDLSKAKAILTKDNRINFSTESGATVSMGLDSYLLNQVLR